MSPFIWVFELGKRTFWDQNLKTCSNELYINLNFHMYLSLTSCLLWTKPIVMKISAVFYLFLCACLYPEPSTSLKRFWLHCMSWHIPFTEGNQALAIFLILTRQILAHFPNRPYKWFHTRPWKKWIFRKH